MSFNLDSCIEWLTDETRRLFDEVHIIQRFISIALTIFKYDIVYFVSYSQLCMHLSLFKCTVLSLV